MRQRRIDQLVGHWTHLPALWARSVAAPQSGDHRQRRRHVGRHEALRNRPAEHPTDSLDGCVDMLAAMASLDVLLAHRLELERSELTSRMAPVEFPQRSQSVAEV